MLLGTANALGYCPAAVLLSLLGDAAEESLSVRLARSSTARKDEIVDCAVASVDGLGDTDAAARRFRGRYGE
jgi:hypothetical protein